MSVKFEVGAIRQEGRCKACGGKLQEWKDTQFDHVPALQLRTWDEDAGDTTPPANDPEFIEAKHKDCHLAKTTGRAGESKKGDTRLGDVSQIARTKRLAKKTDEFRRRLLAKDSGEEPPPPKKAKRKIPSRPFPKRGERSCSD